VRYQLRYIQKLGPQMYGFFYKLPKKSAVFLFI